MKKKQKVQFLVQQSRYVLIPTLDASGVGAVLLDIVDRSVKIVKRPDNLSKQYSCKWPKPKKIRTNLKKTKLFMRIINSFLGLRLVKQEGYSYVHLMLLLLLLLFTCPVLTQQQYAAQILTRLGGLASRKYVFPFLLILLPALADLGLRVS